MELLNKEIKQNKNYYNLKVKFVDQNMQNMLSVRIVIYVIILFIV